MKKSITFTIFSLFVVLFFACPSPTPDNTSANTELLQSLSNRTFSYFALDEDEDEIRIKEQLVFSAFNEKEKIITASLYSASWTSENKTQQGAKIKDLELTSKDLKQITFSLNKTRTIDNSLTFENKTFEECSQEYKWAKILENKKWEHVFELEHQKMEFFEIDLQNKKMNMFSSTNAGGTEEEYSGEYYYDIEKKQMYWSNDYPSQYSNFFNIKENSFKKQYQTGSSFIKYDKVENWSN